MKREPLLRIREKSFLECELAAKMDLTPQRGAFTMEIRIKHLRASFEAGFEAGLEKTEAKQYDKEETLFWSSKRKKKQARKNGPPQFKLPIAAVADQISFNLQ